MYSEKVVNQAAQLMKYCEVVRDLALKGGDWHWYGERFRYLRQSSLEQYPYTLFQNGGCLRRSGSSSTRARHRGPRFNVYMFTCGSIVRNMPQNCCVPGCKKKVYEEDGVKISFHKFPEDRELFRKWIVAIRRDVCKEFRVTDHTRV